MPLIDEVSAIHTMMDRTVSCLFADVSKDKITEARYTEIHDRLTARGTERD